ncbi:C40 family peptidase [uncultured Anaerococcus sp.]|uniref:C40 family peptidase n=1 Tax=uncultured Anaerococcus sp. TaxID=293428 RepID=UPI0025E1D876|nr:C40 family peptidase [uncultured Anaerococcus sp.]
MAKRFQKAFITSLIFSQFFINPAISQADSIVLNKNTTDGVNVRVKEDVNSEILGGIEDFTAYEIKNESNDWYQIEFEGKKGYVAKKWFYKLNHTSLLAETNLKEKANSDSNNLTDQKLKEKTKVTILEFIPDSDFVKVSYDEDFKDNKKINTVDIKELENSSLLYDLADTNETNDVQTVTLGKENTEIPSVVTLKESPEAVALDTNTPSDEASDDDNTSEIKEGYVKLEDLAISKKDPSDLEKMTKFYNEMNNFIKDQKAREEAAKNAVREITEISYVTTTTSENQVSNTSQSQKSDTVMVPVTGSQTGNEIYKWATQYLGNPYVWGGIDPVRGIDCSGFTMQAYRQIGINLPHFAQSQQRYGVEIPFGQEKAGDLVFFGTSLNNITHVGMADGNGNMIHASSPRYGIIIGPIRNPISIRRIVN